MLINCNNIDYQLKEKEEIKSSYIENKKDLNNLVNNIKELEDITQCGYYKPNSSYLIIDNNDTLELRDKGGFINMLKQKYTIVDPNKSLLGDGLINNFKIFNNVISFQLVGIEHNCYVLCYTNEISNIGNNKFIRIDDNWYLVCHNYRDNNCCSKLVE
ncbi:MAG: hypothetical protein A2046_02180 [Bacteroidetes bacterium GWA2_30_7]|nr:MAG: hypothetical protein A2046_02180 [Bacteroidetes bacterium GWA2_30_7]